MLQFNPVLREMPLITSQLQREAVEAGPRVSMEITEGLTRSNPKEMSGFELCLHCLARKTGLISPQRSQCGCAEVGFHIWDLPKSYIILS
ncbi:hypothetical protein DV515_00005789 [Chloebia gouldiae]|uniref:Uncharacterized protein n=1 Tax=Chloebia gouldiae TaxID=44316 RepID=A0A3L8SLS7_CHLGU|nr:hypothetical protein DV515_00005789 [Chloebia gouldiae]